MTETSQLTTGETETITPTTITKMIVETTTILQAHTTKIILNTNKTKTETINSMTKRRIIGTKTTMTTPTKDLTILITTETDLQKEADTLTTTTQDPITTITGDPMTKISETTDHLQETETDTITQETTKI
mgnify:CR=1 FL=1